MSNSRKRKYDDYFKTIGNKHECQKCFQKFEIQGQSGTSVRKGHFEKCWTKNDVDLKTNKMRQPTLTEMGEISLQSLLNELCVRLIVEEDLPFRFVESHAFKAVVRFQCPSSVRIPDRKQIRNELLENMAKKFKQSLSKNIDSTLPVACQFDEYSNKQIRLFTVTLTQINSKFKIKTFRLGVKSLGSERASAENLKILVTRILDEFGIKNVSGATRDGALEALCASLKMPSVHCINHILNLAVQDGYKALDPKIEAIKNCVARMTRSKLSMNILRSECKAAGTLFLFTKIRWNSFAKTLQSFLKNYDALRRFEVSPAAKNLPTTLHIPTLTTDELDQLKDFNEFLLALEGLTKLAESRQCPCSTIIYIRHRIHVLIHLGKKSNNKLINDFIAEFEEKWLKYSDSLKENQLIKFAAFFDPRIVCKKYLSKEEWLQTRDEVLKLVPDETPTNVNTVQQIVSSYDDDDEDEPPSNEKIPNFKAQVIAYWDHEKVGPISKTNGEWVTRIDEMLTFWRTKEHIWPELTAFARKYLTVTASSAEPERVFSHITRLLTNFRRNRLEPEKLEEIIQVREYLALEKMEENYKKDDEFSDDEEEEEDSLA